MLNLGRQEFVESWKEGDVAFVKMVTKPNTGAWLPASAQKSLVKDDQLEMVDTIELGPQLERGPPYVLPVESQIPALGGKTDIRFKITIIEAGPNKTKQILDGNANIKIFGLGKLAEKMLKRSMKQTYDKLPEVVQKWQMHRNEMIARGPGDEARLLAGRPSVLQDRSRENQENQSLKKIRGEADGGGTAEQQTTCIGDNGQSRSTLHPAPTAYFSAASSQEEDDDQRGQGQGTMQQEADGNATPQTAPSCGMLLGESLQSLQSFNEASPEWARYWNDLGITSTKNVYVERFGRVVKVTRRLGLAEGAAVHQAHDGEDHCDGPKTTRFSIFSCCKS
jgi:hypothetical protein